MLKWCWQSSVSERTRGNVRESAGVTRAEPAPHRSGVPSSYWPRAVTQPSRYLHTWEQTPACFMIINCSNKRIKTASFFKLIHKNCQLLEHLLFISALRLDSSSSSYLMLCTYIYIYIKGRISPSFLRCSVVPLTYLLACHNENAGCPLTAGALSWWKPHCPTVG